LAILNAERISYAPTPRFSIHDVNITAEQGERIAIIGPNGSGKSTMLRLITRLLQPNTGTVVLDGHDIRAMKGNEIAKILAMLPQMQTGQHDLTVRDLVRYGRHPYQRWFSGMSKEDREIVEWAIHATRMDHLADQQLQSLSGGERQRAWIAMSLAQLPKVLLLDEPTTFLDISHQFEILELISQLNKEMNMTIVSVLHDINQAAQYSDRLIVMKEGRMVAQGTPSEVLTHEMFEQVFEITVRIHYDDPYPYVRLMQCLRCDKSSCL